MGDMDVAFGARNSTKKMSHEQGVNFEDADFGASSKTLQQTSGSNRVFSLKRDAQSERQNRSNKVITSRYTLLSFIPVNTFEQFVYRPVNLYFLGLVPLQMIQSISTSRGIPTVLNPLCFVLAVAAIKDGIEDYRRHKSDHLENNRTVTCKSDTSQKKSRWADVKVGDTILIFNHEMIPADVVILDTSDDLGCAYVETANLDGETNLKAKGAPTRCVTYFASQSIKDPMDMMDKWFNISGKFECEEPNGSLYTFEGLMEIEQPEKANVAFTAYNIMLRGCKLRNTTWAVCKVVSTGKDTKIQRNSVQKVRKKVTFVEMFALRILVLFFLAQCVLCTVGAGYSASFEADSMDSDSTLYLNLHDRGTSEAKFFDLFVIRWLTFVLILANFIPISLMVTLSMVKFGQAFFILRDKTMVHKGQNAVPRTSDLNESLGQVDTIFSDKTGTLTQNLMEFRRCYVGGRSYGTGLTEIQRQVLMRKGEHVPPEQEPTPGQKVTPCVNFIDDDLVRNLKDPVHRESIFEFFLHLAINHTVIVEEADEPGAVATFSAASPDEGALVYGAKHFDFIFLDRQLGKMRISCPGFDPFTVEILVSIDFTSMRKRSSTIAKFFHPIKQREVIMLYVKGADSIVEARLSPKEQLGPAWRAAKEVMGEYALDGLRTLVFAGRELTEEEFSTWYANYETAMNSMHDRSKKMELVAELIETRFQFHAGSGIEDRLQDEVGQTIQLLQQAGIKIWMLTGDKVETAINIGVATGLIEPELMDEHMVVFDWGALPSVERQPSGKAALTQLSKREPQFDTNGILKDLDYEGDIAVSRAVVQSITLDAEGEEEKTKRQIQTCNALFTKSLGKLRQDRTSLKTIVIDGSSLACMLERPSDFVELTCMVRCVLCCRVSPDQKGQVVRLIRSARKSVTLAIGDGANDCNMIRSAHVGVGIHGEEGLQAFNVCDYGISQFRFLQGLLLVHGRYAYRRISIVVMYMFYKNTLVVVPQFLLGFYSHFSGMRLYLDLMYQVYNMLFTSFPILAFGILDRDTSRANCYRFPELYKLGPQNHYLNWKNVSAYVMAGIWHSLVVFYVPYLSLASTVGPDGKSADLWVHGTMIILLEVIVVNAKLVIECSTLNNSVYLTYALCFLFYLMISVVINNFPDIPFGGFEAYGVASRVFGSGASYLILSLSLVIALSPDVYYKICEYNFFPTEVHKLEAQRKPSTAVRSSKSDPSDNINHSQFP